VPRWRVSAEGISCGECDDTQMISMHDRQVSLLLLYCVPSPRLGYRAFLQVLKRKGTSYPVIINHLEQACRTHGSVRMMKHLKPVLSHPSNASLRKIPY